jgi:hypothetical protein
LIPKSRDIYHHSSKRTKCKFNVNIECIQEWYSALTEALDCKSLTFGERPIVLRMGETRHLNAKPEQIDKHSKEGVYLKLIFILNVNGGIFKDLQQKTSHTADSS